MQVLVPTSWRDVSLAVVLQESTIKMQGASSIRLTSELRRTSLPARRLHSGRCASGKSRAGLTVGRSF